MASDVKNDINGEVTIDEIRSLNKKAISSTKPKHEETIDGKIVLGVKNKYHIQKYNRDKNLIVDAVSSNPRVSERYARNQRPIEKQSIVKSIQDKRDMRAAAHDVVNIDLNRINEEKKAKEKANKFLNEYKKDSKKRKKNAGKK